MKEDIGRILEKQHYRTFGEHAAVKLCHWMRQSLLKHRCCYKEEFYGIRSHRCLQMTPVVNQCTHNCLFCWRLQGFESDVDSWMDPEIILDSCITQQRLLISGFKGDSRCSLEMFEEARNPNQVAKSLAGEPTIYPRLGELIDVCRKRGMTTFLVTNGTFPEALKELDPLPTQLYVTVAAPNEEIYKRLCVPRIADGWSRLRKTLELLPSLGTRTVIRHTLVQEWNIGWEEQYAKLDEVANPLFIEPKGYVFVGDSRRRMSISNMPSHKTVQDFASRLASILDIDVLKERPDSRVVLLGERGARLSVQ
jgi:tRNA wybutosine-synthesizing protein 1